VIPSRREIGTGQSDSHPVPWSRRERDGKGRVLPRNAKKLRVTLKVIIKAIISYLILSISLFWFSTGFRDGREGTGRVFTTLVPSRRVARDGTTTLHPVPFPDGTGAPGGVVPVPGEA
jgi:hypothetical protein